MITKIEVIENLLKIGDYEKFFRINHNGRRLYIRTNPFKYYSGLTGAMEACEFKGNQEARRLSGWRDAMIDSYGKKSLEDYVNLTADFGTLVHEALVNIKDDGKLNWHEQEMKARAYFESSFNYHDINKPDILIDKMIYEYMLQASSLMQFVHERVNEIYAIEAVCWDDELNIATPVDIYCKARPTPKADPVNMVVNIKTSKSITDHHINQVSMEKYMWEKTYGDVEMAAILRTKNWTKTPTYEMKAIGTEEIERRCSYLRQKMALCVFGDDSYYPNVTSKKFVGETKVGEIPVIEELTLEQEWNGYQQGI